MAQLRQLGRSDIYISSVAMGCWPIAGMTSLDVNDSDSINTLHAALASGVNFFDTAYAYGAKGESERLIARAFDGRRDEVVIATKCGLGWNQEGQRIIDGRPETLKQQFDESLIRLSCDHVEVLYLHAPDPSTPITDSAGAMLEMLQSGKTRTVGVSNFSVDQLDQFHTECPITVVQPPYNMLQRQIEQDIVPWCQAHNVSIAVYWPLMKGLLAGKLPRDHQFAPEDGRAKYPMFQGSEWQRNQDFVDELRLIAQDYEKTVAQIVVFWTLQQPGITTVLCGAKRPYQIVESAAAMADALDDQILSRMNAALVRRGKAQVGDAV